MADSIYKVDYFSVEIPDEPGSVFRILMGLKEAGVNLLACSGSPLRDGKVVIDFVPEYNDPFVRAASHLGLQLSEPGKAFLVQEGERIGAEAEAFAKLAKWRINVAAHQAVSAGAGRWGMVLRVRPEDYERACEALGF